MILRIDHSLERKVHRIAVCKFVGMGSIVQSTPLLKTLRKNFPDAWIVFVTNKSNRLLFDLIDEVDEVITISDKSIFSLVHSSFRMVWKLWRNRPDVFIDLEIYSNYSSVITTLSLSRNRMGFFKDDKTYRKGMYTHMMFYNLKAPVSNTYLQFSRLMNCREIVQDVSLNRSRISDQEIISLREKLELGTKPYLLINPNASDLRLERRWPAEKVIALINSISQEYNSFHLVLIGDKTESEHVKLITSKLDANVSVIDSSGRMSLRELIVLIGFADLLVTNDTGPMHLAFALRTATVSLFGPCTPQQYGGTEKTISIYKNLYCSPCVHEFIIPPCKGDNQCMKKIDVSEVAEAIRKALKNDFISAEKNQIDYRHLNGEALGMVVR
ncbi:MAG: glycosyltransferase family 9 protein [Bacteroidota bacterium]|nr:glycosyltransferase family 9 protein [Bacteroidota bacterium]